MANILFKNCRPRQLKFASYILTSFALTNSITYKCPRNVTADRFFQKIIHLYYNLIQLMIQGWHSSLLKNQHNQALVTGVIRLLPCANRQ